MVRLDKADDTHIFTGAVHDALLVGFTYDCSAFCFMSIIPLTLYLFLLQSCYNSLEAMHRFRTLSEQFEKLHADHDATKTQWIKANQDRISLSLELTAKTKEFEKMRADLELKEKETAELRQQLELKDAELAKANGEKTALKADVEQLKNEATLNKKLGADEAT